MRKNIQIAAIWTLVVALALPVLAADSRTRLKPGWNIFSPQQDVEMGREVAQEAERELPILNDRKATAYIDALGKRLAAHAPGEKYPYQFRIVNDKAINAFALPGGYIYINRGIIEAAANEAQLAGVVAHEISHVAMRHGTNQVSKAYLAQAPLAIVGGILGSNSVGSVLAQLGVGFATNSILLKYSRDAERQADLMGTQILYDAGYDPKAMVEFFERLQSESKGRAAEFFSSHPNPENRISGVQGEIQKLGGPRAGARADSPDFHSVKNSIASMPAGGKGASRSNDRGDVRNGRPADPSGRMVNVNAGGLQFPVPENWRQYGQGSALTFAPDGGIVSGSLAWGLIIGEFEPHYDRDGRITLEEATDQLLDELRRSNSKMRITRGHERIRVGGQRALSTEVSNESPVGGREADWIVTVMDPNGQMYYFVAVAPSKDFNRYSRTFEEIIDSVRFR